MNETIVKCVTLAAETVIFVALAVLVGTGHDTAITDAMLVVGGAILGSELVPAIRRITATKE